MSKKIISFVLFGFLSVSLFAQNAVVRRPQPQQTGSSGKQSPGLDVLGFGYDVFGFYADQASKKRYCLFKFANYHDIPVGAEQYSVPQYVFLENISKHITKTVSGESIRDYAKHLSVEAGLSGETMFFKGSINASYDTKTTGTEQKYYFTYMDANTKWRISFDERSLSYLKNILEEQFKNDLATMDPTELFKLYGTHFIASAYLGGRADYSSVSTISEKTTTKKISAAITAEFESKFSGNKISTNVNTQSDNQNTLRNANTSTKLKVTGGNSEYANNISDPETYLLWADGIKDMPVLCDFDKGSLRPIWDLCDSPARMQVLKGAFNKLCETNPLPEAFADLAAVKNNAYMIKNKATGLFFDFPGMNPINAKEGDKLNVYGYDNNSVKNQGFDRIYRIETCDTDPEFVFIHPQHTNMVLDITGGNINAGTPIQIWNQNKTISQMFKLIPVDGEANTYFIKTKNNLCLELRPNNSAVVLGSFTGGDNQKWKLEDFNPQNIVQPAEGAYAIQCLDGDLLWDFAGTYPDVRENKLQLWTAGNAIGDRSFKIARLGDYNLIRPMHHPSNVLTANKDAQITNEKQTRADNQQFKFEYAGYPLAYNILNKGTNQLITANGDRTRVSGCPVTSWVKYGGLNQCWRLYGPSAGQTPIHEGSYLVKCEQSNKYWDLSGKEDETNKNGVRAQIWDNDGGYDRKITFEPCNDDIEFYRIKFGNGRYLDVSGPWEWSASEKALDVMGKAPLRKKDKGAKLQCYESTNNDAQKFKVVYVGNNAFSILSKINGRAIDISGGKINENGPDLQLWDWNQGNAAQRFVLINSANNQPYRYE